MRFDVASDPDARHQHMTVSLATTANPAGGGQLWQLAVIAGVYWGGTGGLWWLVQAHRSGRTRVLARAGAAAAWVFRLPRWAALPVVVAVVSLLCLMFGGFWDIGYHIDKGRDPGPLGNPGHWPMLLGFFGSFAAGFLALGLADQRDATPAWIALRRDWRVPVGGVLMTGCSAFGLAALPIDDLWHRIFGQDVTLWSPTHFLLLGGATMTVIGMIVLTTEGARARALRPQRRVPVEAPLEDGAPWARLELPGRHTARLARVELFAGQELARRIGRIWSRAQRFALMGGMLAALEAFLAEYDWGVPLYRQVWQPLLLAAFAGLVFTAARSSCGRGGALGAWAIYLIVRLAATLMPVLAGESPSMLPLFFAEALCVELVATQIHPRGRPLAFGAAAGLLCGTAGFAAEYGWSQVAMPLPWTPALIPEGLPSAALAGVAGGLLGALFAAALRRELPPRRVARSVCIGAFALLVALGVNAGMKTLPNASAHVQLTDVRAAPHREAFATIRLDPANAADHANWFYILAWQGHAPRIVDRLQRLGEGVYRSIAPIPLDGTWKIGLRLNRGRARGAVALRLPADAALANANRVLPASYSRAQAASLLRKSNGAELPAAASFTRPFVEDGWIVLREERIDVPSWVWAAAIALIGVLYTCFIAALSLGVARFARRDSHEEASRARSLPTPVVVPGAVR
ncbi:MAG: hypothetical protein ACR2HD_08530 [Solirubrobacteraceae bacterium]